MTTCGTTWIQSGTSIYILWLTACTRHENTVHTLTDSLFTTWVPVTYTQYDSSGMLTTFHVHTLIDSLFTTENLQHSTCITIMDTVQECWQYTMYTVWLTVCNNIDSSGMWQHSMYILWLTVCLQQSTYNIPRGSWTLFRNVGNTPCTQFDWQHV